MQQKVQQFNNKCGQLKPLPVHARLLDISSELGELAKEYLKATDYGSSGFTLTKEFEEEFGDVLYSMLSLASELNINSSKALDIVLNKYQARINKNKNMGSGR